ncbi:MAG TPA: HAD-IB family phosphatase [Thermoplasmata archaeon]|nr:HAD-IB family phosphatase [Thermoplasmata archaeon]
MSKLPPFRMFIDFDGTLVEPNVAIVLVEEFCADGKRVAHEIDELLHTGKITLREAWRRQVELMRADQIPAMAEWSVRNIPFREGAEDLLALLRRHNVPTSIVSGGLDFYIAPILKNAGIDLPVFCDGVEVAGGGMLEVVHPYGHATCRLCGICKAQIVRNAEGDHVRTVFAGDGSTDRYAAEVADIVFARRRLRLYCDAASIPYYPFEKFAPVTEQLERWLTGAEPLPPGRRVGVASSACPISTSAATA